MKRTNYSLKINNPCNQDWNLMLQTEDGKFCSQCSKTVIDFTKLTDGEIIKIIEKSNGKICGRLTDNQLNRDLVIYQHPEKYAWYKLFAGLLFLSITYKVNANEKLHIEPQYISTFQDESNDSLSQKEKLKNKSKYIVIKGRVLDSLDKPIPFVRVLIKEQMIFANTDSTGSFELEVPKKLLNKEVTMIFHNLGYKHKEYTFLVNNSQLILKVEQSKIKNTPYPNKKIGYVVIKKSEIEND